MKGVVFNVMQEVVEQHLGEAVWDDAVERAGVEGVYTSLGNYPDTDLGALVGALAELADLSRSDVLVFAGRHGFSQFVSRHPDVVAEFLDWRDVVHHLDDIIHPEVGKIYPDIDAPSFEVIADDPELIMVQYRSRRQLCALAEGLFLGLGDWFRQPLAVEHLTCTRHGDAACTLTVGTA